MPGILQLQQRTKQLLAMFREWLGENLDDSTAVQTTFPSIFLGQNELLDATLAFFHDTPGFGPDIGFQASTPHRTDNFAVWRDEHFAFFAHGQRALRRDNRRQRRLFLFIEKINSSLQDIFNHGYASFSKPSQLVYTYYRSLADQCKYAQEPARTGKASARSCSRCKRCIWRSLAKKSQGRPACWESSVHTNASTLKPNCRAARGQSPRWRCVSSKKSRRCRSPRARIASR